MHCAVWTHLDRNVIVANTDFELLLANDVLLWPVGVVFPEGWRVDENTIYRN